jgi:hypothetical protein
MQKEQGFARRVGILELLLLVPYRKFFCRNQIIGNSQICIKRSPFGERKSGLIS